MWDSANEVSRILGVWRCAGMRLRWEAAVGGRRVAGSGPQSEAAAGWAGVLYNAGQKGAVLHELFVFCRLPSKPAHIEQIVFEAYR